MKATAQAHPIQGLIKYHGLADFETRQPLHDSISVCTAPLVTTTTVEAGQAADQVTIDGVEVTGRALERVGDVLDAVRTQASSSHGFKVVSRSTFPQRVGLGSSSSGFAALAMAAQAAAGLQLPASEVARIARLGAGSASRAVTGGVSEWYLEDDDSTSHMLAGPETLDWPILMALVEHEEPTENVHRDVMESPLLDARRAYVEGALSDMRTAVDEGALERVFELAERDTLSLHAITMTGAKGRITWQPATVGVMRTVWALRDSGVPVYFSIDTGATVYVNTLPGHQDRVAEALTAVPGVAKVLRGSVGGPARLVSDHLF
ncbi:MAG: diphosphomevalonate decarboxylase [Candidatus Thermoplasmatota archaeon]|nr:diphosphomevalonate decarboxylase [Candidatus Thermoplasmatota archaeon]